MKSSNNKLSKRLQELVDNLPLYPGIRVLEIGCGTGAAAREISRRIGDGHVFAIDRSAKAIQQAIKSSKVEIDSGRLSFRQIAVEQLELEPSEALYDIAFAVRVGALDGRHPEIEQQAISKIRKALTQKGHIYTDGGDPWLVIESIELCGGD